MQDVQQDVTQNNKQKYSTQTSADGSWNDLVESIYWNIWSSKLYFSTVVENFQERVYVSF